MVKARTESLEMEHVRNEPVIQTGSRELPTLPVACLHQRIHYEIRVTVTRTRPKNIIFSLFMLFILSFCYNKPANGHIYIGNINELKEKNYMTDIEFIIEYDPSLNNNIIYKYSLVSVEIISLYADGVMINSNEDEIQFDGVRISLTEYDENKITRKRRVARYDSRYGWLLFFIPRGEILKLKAYHIPWMTKKLKIVYRIMFPEPILKIV